MENNDNEHLKRAFEYWSCGQPLEAGKLIFERLPNVVRPMWASRVLRLVLEKGGIQSSLFDQVLHTADQQAKWENGHRLFSTIRDSTLKLDEIERAHRLTDEQELFASVLSLAELVAKVTYNATKPDDEFDRESGWWIAACLRGFVDHRWKGEDFSKAAWAALTCDL
jgi:hypothetical protein